MEVSFHIVFRDIRNADGLIGTGLNAGRCFAHGESLMTHIAFSHNASNFEVLRHFIRAGHCTILATEALVVQMAHNARSWILLIRLCWATNQARRLQAMVACCRDMLQYRKSLVCSEQHSHLPPRFCRLQSVKVVAGTDTSLASRTKVEVNFESILLTGGGSRKRNQILVVM